MKKKAKKIVKVSTEQARAFTQEEKEVIRDCIWEKMYNLRHSIMSERQIKKELKKYDKLYNMMYKTIIITGYHI